MINYKNYPGVTGSGPIGLVSRLEHRALEAGVGFHGRVLEVGGGRGEHIRFVKNRFKSYTVLDVFDHESIGQEGNINYIIGDAQSLPFKDASFDRVIVTCVFAHLRDPILAINEAIRVLKPSGLLSILISNDPGVVYTVSWNLFARRFRKKWANEDPVLNHALSHLISGKSLRKVIRSLGGAHSVKSYGFPFVIPMYNLNISTVFQIRISDEVAWAGIEPAT